jgi:hypothetical protein
VVSGLILVSLSSFSTSKLTLSAAKLSLLTLLWLILLAWLSTVTKQGLVQPALMLQGASKNGLSRLQAQFALLALELECTSLKSTSNMFRKQMTPWPSTQTDSAASTNSFLSKLLCTMKSSQDTLKLLLRMWADSQREAMWAYVAEPRALTRKREQQSRRTRSISKMNRTKLSLIDRASLLLLGFTGWMSLTGTSK